MSIDETIKALRNCVYNNSCDGCSFALTVDDEDCKDNMMLAAADQLERLQAENAMLKSGNKQIVEDYKSCVAERDELKANQPVRCGECKHINKMPKNEPYYPGAEKYRCVCLKCGTPTRIDSFCQLGERRGAE